MFGELVLKIIVSKILCVCVCEFPCRAQEALDTHTHTQ